MQYVVGSVLVFCGSLLLFWLVGKIMLAPIVVLIVLMVFSICVPVCIDYLLVLSKVKIVMGPEGESHE